MKFEIDFFGGRLDDEIGAGKGFVEPIADGETAQGGVGVGLARASRAHFLLRMSSIGACRSQRLSRDTSVQGGVEPAATAACAMPGPLFGPEEPLSA